MGTLTTIFGLICLVIAVFGVCLLLGYFEVSPFTALYVRVIDFIHGVDFSTVLSNPASVVTTVAGVAGTATAIGVPLYNKLQTSKQQLIDTKNQAEQQYNSLTNKLSSADEQLTSTTTKLTAANLKVDDLTTANNNLQTKADTLEKQLKEMTNQYTEIQKIKAADFLSTLPGGTLITNPDGSQLAAITKTVVK